MLDDKDEEVTHMYDVIVVGGGPAGATAAVYANRSGLKVLLISRDAGALDTADQIENYYGFVEPISGAELLKRGLEQARRLGVVVETAEVTGITWQDTFQVSTAHAAYEATSVVLATGMPRRKASVPGIKDYEGKGVSYCAVCDGFFYRNKTVAVIGNGDYALSEARELKHLADTVYLATNARPYEAQNKDPDITLLTDRVTAVTGDGDRLGALVFEGGKELAVDGVFVAEGTASALDLALKLGLENDGKAILTGPEQETNLPGLFACGDCTGGLLQIAVAVGEGAKAGMAASGWVRKKQGQRPKAVQWGPKA